MSDKNLKEKRFQIIKPFIEGKKKLKEIENESGISYATLKRWVKSYKETGKTGLTKKIRKDKSQHRNVSDKTLDFIKKTYSANPGIKISALYRKYLDFIKDLKDETISYNTVYRIVTNLDNFVQSHAELHLKRIQKKNQAYRLTHIPLRLKVIDPATGKPSTPFLYLCYDVATLDILNYKLSLKSFSLEDSLPMLRETILKAQIPEDAKFIPEEFIIDAFKIRDEDRAHEVKEILNININNYFAEVPEIEKFLSYLSEDILKIIEGTSHGVDMESLDKVIFSYIYMSNKSYITSCRIIEVRDPFEEKLDILLDSSTRRIQEYGIRFKNKLYRHYSLKDFVGTKAEVRFDLFNPQQIFVYIHDKYLCTAHSN